MSESTNTNINEDLLLTGSRYLNQREYWTNKLDGNLANTTLISLKTNITTFQETTGIKVLCFSDPLCKWIMKLSYANDITIYIILLTGLKALLHRYINTNDVNIVSPLFEPNISDYTLNTHVYICDRLTADMTFKDILLEIRQSVLDAYENQDYPSTKLIQYLFSDAFGEDAHFISDIGCFLEDIHGDKNLADLKSSIAFSFKKQGDKLIGKIIFNAEMYQENTIEHLSDHYLELMRHAMEKVEVRLVDISILSEAEKRQLLVEFNNHKAEFPKGKSIYHYVEDYAQHIPGKIAIGFENEEWSYHYLNQTANQMARLLKNAGVVEDKPVGILMSRSPIMVVTILAVWKSGGAYVPIDIQFPISRITSILNDSTTNVLIVTGEYINSHLKTAYQGNIITVGSVFSELLGGASTGSDANLNQPIDMQSLAYTIYTSGSTGKPKGAMVEHIGMMNHIYAKINDLILSEKSIVSQNASHTFDISVWQFFVALVVAGKTIIYPAELILQPDRFTARLIQDQITILEVVPSYLSVLLASIEDRNPPPLTIEYLLVTGEEVKLHLLNKWFQIYPQIRVVNAYGPTEASDDITHFIMAQVPEMARIPIGKPLQNMNIYIVDDNMRLCPLDVKGEICVSGVGVGRGYLNDVEKTRSVFMTDPFIQRKGQRLYKTGDLGRWLPNGSIEFFGRKDYQVKIRGFRIELEEIENQILNYRNVKEVVVIDKEDDQANKYLCAYITAREILNIPALKDYLSKQLPEYMVPAFLVQLEKMPLTSNGKIDRKALPQNDQSQHTVISYFTKEMLEKLQHAAKPILPTLSVEDKETFFNTVKTEIEKESVLCGKYTAKTREKYYPLSYSQKMIYYTEIKYPGTGSYNICATAKYPGMLDMKCLEKAINLVLEKNEGLRLRIVEVDDEATLQVVQYVSEHKEHDIDYFNFTPKDNDITLDEWIDTNSSKPFQLIDSDLFYFACIKFNEKLSGYFMKIHHIVSDGWTFSLLAAEIDNNYKALIEKNPLYTAPIPSYLQYLDDEKDYLNSARFKDDIEYWYNAVYPFPEIWSLSDKIGDPTNIEAQTILLKLPTDLSMKMIEYCRTNSSSLFRLVLAVFSLYISTTLGLDDLTVGTVAHGRSQKKHREMAGVFINFFPIRINIDHNVTFDTFVNKVCNSQISSSLRHQKLPFNILAAELREFADIDIRDMINTNIVHQSAVDIGGTQTDRYFPKHDPTPLSIHINPSKNKIDEFIELSWTFQVEKFTETRIHEIHQGLINILSTVLENPDKKLSEIEFNISKNVSEKINSKKIASLLLNYDPIEDAEVLIKKDWTDKPIIWAYVVARKKLLESDLREYLSRLLPADMIPSFFIQLEKMPLTLNRKVDRNILKAINLEAVGEYKIPRNAVEEKLVEIWQEILGIEKRKISIDANFFELGGHSLKAITLVTKIHNAFNVKIPLGEIFKTPTIEELGENVKKSTADKHLSIALVEEKEYYELSSAQKRLYVLQQMFANTTSYNITNVVKWRRGLDSKKLENVIITLINRHEALRTSFHLIDREPVQKIAKDNNFKIQYHDIQQTEDTVENILRRFIRPFDLSQSPLISVAVIKLDEMNHLLMYDMHHIISDGASMAILIEEFIELYEGKELPELRIQYKDYSEWQKKLSYNNTIKEQQEYWLKEFEGDIPILALPIDYHRPPVQNFEGAVFNFEVTGDNAGALRTMALTEGATIFMVLLAIFNIFLAKLSGQEDIIIGTPIAGRKHVDLEKIIGMFVNTLVLRNYPVGEKTFKGFLNELKERTLGAFENQDYQFEDLVEKVSVSRDMGRNPLFDVMFVFQNFSLRLNDPLINEVSGSLLPIDAADDYKDLNRTAKFDISLSTVENGGKLEFSFEYCTKLFKRETIERFIIYFREIVSIAVKEPGMKIDEIEIISEGEKKQILYDFNNSKAIYSENMTIHQLFEEQADRTPDHIALIDRELHEKREQFSAQRVLSLLPINLTYRESKKRSDVLAWILVEKGVLADNIVAIMMERSIEMIIGILGILKAGGAYLPIALDYPTERVNYILQDSGAKLLAVANNQEGKKVGRWEGEKVLLEEISKLPKSSSYPLTLLPSYPLNSSNLAYIIYTSGTTGNPKGVMVKHASVVNLLYALQNKYPLDVSDTYLLKTSYVFDVSVTELFGWYMGGGRLVVLERDGEKDPRVILDSIERNCVSHINFVPSMFNVFEEYLDGENKGRTASLKYIFLAGEALLPGLVERFRNLNTDITLENIYGPTESTVYACWYSLSGWDGIGGVPIGKPLPNIKLYIMNKNNNLQPIGIPGELCIRGSGLAWGYLNRPELTAEKFGNDLWEFWDYQDKKNKPSPHPLIPNLYKTGDLCKWLPDGNIEFLGRIDYQVKVRGYRIELGEIENRLLKHEKIKEVVVVANEAIGGEKYIAVYFVSEIELSESELKEYLLKNLPEYMIPSYFVPLERIPLTSTGKIDRIALPRLNLEVSDSYIAPRDEIEKKLLELWVEMLGRDQLHASQLQTSIGIDDSFFQLGGHSLKATVLASRIHKELNVIVPLGVLFKTPTIRSLSEYIRGAVENVYESIMPVEEKEYYVLSFAQKRMYILQQIDLNNAAYNMPQIIPLQEETDIDKLEDSFRKLIKRHDSLRTSFHMIEDQPVQRIHEHVEFKIENVDLAAKNAKGPEDAHHSSFMIHDFFRAFDLSKAPLLRVGLLKKTDGKQYLLVDMHHIISDGISIQVLREDFMVLYNGKELAPLRIQYKDFVQWQNSQKEVERLHQQMHYWLKEFAGEIPVLELPLDNPRPLIQSFEGNEITFEISAEETHLLNTLALKGKGTLFIVLTAVVNILLSKLSGQEEIIIGTPIAGRRHADLEGIIGMFVNTLALRNYTTGEIAFREFLDQVKEKILAAFENQEYPFEGLVDKLSLKRDMGRNPLFDVMFVLQNMNTTSTDLNDESHSKAHRPGQQSLAAGFENIAQTAKFDFTFTAAEIEQKVVFSIQYCTKLFNKETIERFITYFQEIIQSIIDEPGIQLKDIDVVPGKEKERLLYTFNETGAVYPENKTIHELFEEQASKTPDHIALVGADLRFCPPPNVSLTYHQLSEQSNQLARVLIEKGVLPGNIVAVMMERSIEMITGIIGILKSGAAYLPLNPRQPESRTLFMIKDSGAKLLAVVNGLEGEKVRRWEGEKNLEIIFLDFLSSSSFVSSYLPNFLTSNPFSLAYIIYTSGSTGKPKGVLVEHRSVVNTLSALQNLYPFNANDVYLLKTAYTFDVSVTELFGWFWGGGRLAILVAGSEKDPREIVKAIVAFGVTHINFVPSMFNFFIEALEYLTGKTSMCLKYIFLAGEALLPDMVKKFRAINSTIALENLYGPTEATIYASKYSLSGWEYSHSIPIGKSLSNINLYVVNAHLEVQPIGVLGELCIGGIGVARGYLNRPELTAEKFRPLMTLIKNKSFGGGQGGMLRLFQKSPLVYRTGDLVRWLPDGNIEFLGRIDCQIKIRGFRVELGEIENRLINYPGIKEAVVTAQEDESCDKYLSAYLVSDFDSEYEISGIREFLLNELPEYMIPSSFVYLDKIPLTSSGKVDRKALPNPEFRIEQDHVSPRNEMEVKLVKLWADVLNIQPDFISIDSNFFQLGGHSLKATIFASIAHKEINVFLPLVEIFKKPTIRGLSEYIRSLEENIYESIMPVEEKEYYILSFAQQRMYILQQLNLSSTAYNMPQIIPLSHEFEINKLEDTFNKLINRHESLRTSFHMIGDQPLQKIHREVGFKIEKYEESHVHQFVRAFDLSCAPLLRVGELKTVEGRYYLLVDMHHIISDGISMQVLRDDFMGLYERKELPPLRIQYKDFAQWQNSPQEVERLDRQMLYWLKEFEGEIPLLEIPLDYPRPVIQSFEGNSIDFEISTEETRALNAEALQGGATLFMVLMAAVNILLFKLSGQEEIIIGTPIAGRRHSDLEKIIGMFVNTLVLRSYPAGERTFKEFLDEIKERTLMAFENQEYPFEELVDKLPLKRDMGRNPLFDVMFVMQNINTFSAVLNHESLPESEQSVQPDLPKEYENIARTAKFDLRFAAAEIDQKIIFSAQYGTKLFKKETIERYIAYFKNIIYSIVKNPGIKLQEIDVLSKQEKEQLLVDFNNTVEVFPTYKTIHQLFEEQAEKTPERVALVGADLRVCPVSLTYRELNKQSDRLAELLIEKGVMADVAVGIMVERSVEMIVGIMGILKSGGAYLPIDPDYPDGRIDYMLKDSGAKLLVTTNNKGSEKVRRWECENVFLEEIPKSPKTSSYHLTFSPSHLVNPSNLAYIIYTSGSTGTPKGVMIEHRSLVNLVFSLRNTIYRYANPVSIALISPIYFDASIKQIFPALVWGHRLAIVSKTDIISGSGLVDFYRKFDITVSDGTPSHLILLLDAISTHKIEGKIPVKCFVIGGDILKSGFIQKLVDITDGREDKKESVVINVYGPTECCDVSTTYTITRGNINNYNSVPIGTPLANIKMYVVGIGGTLQPGGVAGELCIAGAGLGRGYLNRPELTAERFINFTIDNQQLKLYRSGDLGRWLADGNIEFSGRVDQQVKIRGFRVELGEIENRLLKYPGIKEVVILARENDEKDKFLCAYIVSDNEFEIAGIRESLLKGLPDYMIPSYFVRLERIPLTSNGKVDRNALPKPELKIGQDYVAPRNRTEVKLVELWAGVLNIQPEVISIDRNFFELGGHSLKATVLASRIHKELNVQLPLAELFKTPTVRGLSNYIRGAVKNIYESIIPVEEKEYYVLSFSQKRMYILQQIDLNSTAYNMPGIFPLPGEIDIDRLEESFKKLIKRHDSLRTSFHMIGDQPLQKIHREVGFKIEKYEESHVHQFVRAFDLSCAPLLRVGELKTVEGSHYLLVDMHHIISDGISMQVLRDDFMGLYDRKELPSLRIQYKDFAQWQNSPQEVERLDRQMLYWLKEFEGEIPLLEIPLDYPRPMIQSFEGDSLNFEISDEDTRALNALALQGGATRFMLLTAAVNILLSKLSGQEEIIIGIPIAGRRHSDLEKIIGMFVNTLALRSYPTGDRTFNEFLGDVKERILMAFENQEYPFEELVDKLSLKRDMGRNPLFDVMFVLQNMNAVSADPDDEPPPETEQSVQPDFPKGYESIGQTAKFDLTFTAVEIGRKTLFSIQYCTKLFKKETIERFITYFKIIVRSIVHDPGIKLQHINIISEKEKEQLLFDFNKTDEIYSKEIPVYRLFEEQAEQIPGNIAITGPSAAGENIQLSYRELNEKSNQLAHALRAKGITHNNVVGIMIRRSIEMIVSIFGVLKSGGTYMPIDSLYPLERKQRMLKDSSAKLLLTEGNGEVGNIGTCEFIDIKNKGLFNVSTGNPGIENLGDDLIYTIFTSGSTGFPKGSGVYHRGFLNLVYWYVKEFDLNSNDGVLLLTSLSFDLTQKNIYSPLSVGGRLHIPGGDYFEPSALLMELRQNKVTWINCTPGMFYKMVEVEEDRNLLSGLRYVFLGGEPISLKMLSAWLESAECNAELVNTYGPTECTDVCTYYRLNDWEHYRENVIPIGKPIYNTQLYILNRNLQMTPVGVVGELFIAGVGVGAGYINNSEMTWGKFVKISLNGSQPVVCYRTGDLARWLPVGNIEFLGRIDHQLKIRGFRIELGEIENRLLNYPGINETVVLVKEGDGGDKSLCAYIVSDRDYGISDLREFLSIGLPDHMIPAYFVRFEKIPLTPNGKIDREALPKPELKAGQDRVAAPRNSTEAKLVELWAYVLNIQPDIISIDKNFFELGGHSLKATVLASKIHKELNVLLPLVELFKTPTIRGLSEYIRGTSENIYESIIPVEEKEYYVLSFAQKRMYILQQIDLNSTAYNIPEIIPLDEGVDINRLEESFKRLINRHESLRTSFHMIGDLPMQKVCSEIVFKIERYEASTVNQFVRAFDLSCAPLLRVGELKKAEAGNYLLVDMHHIISDGISIQVLREDFMALYDGKELAPLRIQYIDFAQWQNSPKEIERLHWQMLYWLKEFEGEIPVLEIPTDYPRPMVQSFEGNSIDFEISAEETRALKAAALQGGATPFMVLAAAVNILLSKLSGHEEIIIGTPIAGRRHSDLEKIIGMFVNTLALRSHFIGEISFREFLDDVKKRVLMAFENQEYPFEELVDKLSLKRDMGRNPLFDVMFVLQNMNTVSAGADDERLSENQQSVQPDSPKGYENMAQTAKFDLTFAAMELGQKTRFSIQYCTKLFKKESIQRFSHYFMKIVSQIIEYPGLKLREIEITMDEERRQLLFEFNNAENVYPNDKTIHGLFEEQVERTPDHIALSVQPVQPVGLSYLELNQQSNRLATLLRENGVEPGDIVGIMAERSNEMIIGLLGILKSGGAYLPLNPRQPEARTQFMMKDSGVKLLVVMSDKEGEKVRGWEGEKVLLEEIFNSPKISSYPLTFLPSYPLNSSNLAYLIYTSGSTGNPKGVPITHANFSPLVHWGYRIMGISGADRFLQNLSYFFDWSVWEIFFALTAGAGLYITGEDVLLDGLALGKFIGDNEITVLHITPSQFQVLVGVEVGGKPVKLDSLKHLCLGAEKLTYDLVKRSIEMVPANCRIYNMYGPTEATIIASVLEINRNTVDKYENLGSVPIGIPVGNTQLYILDRYFNLCPLKVVGELYIGGEGLAGGYLNNPELTAEKFNRSYRSYKTYIKYKTGDLSRWLPDGTIEFLGRSDHQVKIRGFRIELGEIENKLLEHERIKAAVVIVMGETGLCAYIVPEGQVENELEFKKELKEYLTDRLPGYMVPGFIALIKNISLTPNGKVDLRALPHPEALSVEEYIAPRDAMEAKLVELWADVLNIQPGIISIDRSFFGLGGHSLKATVLAFRIHKELNAIVPLSELFKSPTIRDLAEYIKNTKSNIQRDIDWNVVLIKEGLPGDNHLFFIHDGSGEVEGYVEFCKQLTNNFNCWGLRADRLENLAPRAVTIEELVGSYIEKIKKVQPKGPYYIAGWSLGGTIAFEMAAQLERKNEEIVFLALIDSPPPHKNLWKEAADFNLESELHFVKDQVAGIEVEEKLKTASELSSFWLSIVDYLETNRYDAEMIKKVIRGYGFQALPNYDQLGIKESIYYLNVGRTLSNARAHYIPDCKLKTQVYYFKASQSKNIAQKHWEKYCGNPIKYTIISGDHFSIFKIPEVVQFADTFGKILPGFST